MAAPQRHRHAQAGAHILEIHAQLADLIEMRDAAGARALMNDHVKMIRARRVAEHGHSHDDDNALLLKAQNT